MIFKHARVHSHEGKFQENTSLKKQKQKISVGISEERAFQFVLYILPVESGFCLAKVSTAERPAVSALCGLSVS